MKKILILFLSVMCLSSCVEDEGNYIYTAVNEITIEGLEESYYVLQGIDTLKIQPKITGTVLGEKLDNYEYQWHLHKGIAEHKHTVIYKGEEKDLSYKVNVPLGEYTLYFTVLDKTTGIKEMASATLTVATSTTKGFLLLGDNMEEDIVGLDMIVMPTGRDTSIVENVYDNSETRYRKAESILFQGQYTTPREPEYTDYQSLWMCTGDGSFRMNNREEISVLSELNEMGMIELSTDYSYKKPMRVLDVFPHQGAQAYGTTVMYRNRSTMYRGYMTEDVCVFGSMSNVEYFGTPVNRLSANSTELFNIYPKAFFSAVATSAFAASTIVIYNMEKNCFMKVYCFDYCAKPLNDNPTEKFPWNQENRTIVWGGNSVNAKGSSYAIMKDLDANNYYLYKFTTSSGYSASITKEDAWDIDLAIAENFEKASHYAVSGTGNILIYSYGSTLYLYDYEFKELLTQPMDGEITYLDLEFASTASRTAFMVATYNETDKGIVRKFDVGTNPNVLEIIERPNDVWHTRLRVKDVEWKTSM